MSDKVIAKNKAEITRISRALAVLESELTQAYLPDNIKATLTSTSIYLTGRVNAYKAANTRLEAQLNEVPAGA